VDISQLSSLIGAALLLFAFIALSFRRLSSESIVYHMFNFLGAILLCVSATLAINYGFLILNGAWTVVSGLTIIRLIKSRK